MLAPGMQATMRSTSANRCSTSAGRPGTRNSPSKRMRDLSLATPRRAQQRRAVYHAEMDLGVRIAHRGRRDARIDDEQSAELETLLHCGRKLGFRTQPHAVAAECAGDGCEIR